jgi:putative hemolysin
MSPRRPSRLAALALVACIATAASGGPAPSLPAGEGGDERANAHPPRSDAPATRYSKPGYPTIPSSPQRPPAGPSNSTRANPAHAHCLAHGGRIAPIIRNGIPSDADCVNPTTGQRCRVWSYYRGECRL